MWSLSVAGEEERAEQHASYAAELFVKHGIDAVPHGIRSNAAPADIVLAQAEALGAAMIAVGASGQNALQSWLLGSASSRLLDVCPCPLFVHH
jgi:nucleotide-binding universal stress UspA family protein